MITIAIIVGILVLAVAIDLVIDAIVGGLHARLQISREIRRIERDYRAAGLRISGHINGVEFDSGPPTKDLN